MAPQPPEIMPEQPENPSVPPAVTIEPPKTTSESPLESVQKGFELLALASTFLAGVQAQVMTITISTSLSDQTTVICLINACFLIALVLDIMGACLSFLTFRWLQRLSHEEKIYFNQKFGEKDQFMGKKGARVKSSRVASSSFVERVIVWWSSLSLFIPMAFVLCGVGFLAIGIQIYIWTLQRRLVAILVTIAYAAVTPFVFGLFIIGRVKDRRERIIDMLSERQGDW